MQIPSNPKIVKCTITKETVLNKAKPNLIKRENKKSIWNLLKKTICKDLNVRKLICEMIKDYDKYDDIISLSDGTHGRIYSWPDSWFITPNGYLYNTGSGHKQGNLLYPYYQHSNNFNTQSLLNIFPAHPAM